MDRQLRVAFRRLEFDPTAIIEIRRIYRLRNQPMSAELLMRYVPYIDRQQIIGYLVNLLSTDGIVPERFEGQECIDGVYYYSGWTGNFETNQPLIRYLERFSPEDILSESGRYPWDYPQFSWALPCEDSTHPDVVYPRNFNGGEAFGSLPALCNELTNNIRTYTGCDMWRVNWSHGTDVEFNMTDLTEEEWQERIEHGIEETPGEKRIFEDSGVHVDWYSNTHGFFIWFEHPITQHIVDQIESVRS